MRMPNFFIVGSPKAGTTAMAKYLAEHPQIFMSDPKEPHHFNTDQNYGAYKDPEAYASLFERAHERHHVVGEASVWYLYSREAVLNIEAQRSGAKYLVMLRNPIELAPSLHQQMLFSGWENEVNFEDAWRRQDSHRNAKAIPICCDEPSFLLYKISCSIGMQLQRLFQTVPRERIHIIFHDDLLADPITTWSDFLRFLGVEQDGRTKFQVVNAAKERKSQMLLAGNEIYWRFRQTFDLPNMGTGILERLNKWNIRSRPRNPLQHELRKELQHAFESDICLLESLTKRDLSLWKQ